MTRTVLPWFETLTDSVHALGAAAREAQRAYQAASITSDQYDLDRLRSHDGELALPSRRSTVPFRPYDHALFVIADHQRTHADRLRRLYAQTTEGYAYGATWAIRQVLDGRQPPAVELDRTDQGSYVIPGEAYPSSQAFEALKRWSGKTEFDRALSEMERLEAAAEYASDLNAEYHLADHEASAMHDAYRVAEGLPEATYTYGQHAETALRFALLEPRKQHTHS
ncbi:hypothetical protein [Streptomyces sp. NPDC089799]|uniref:hypothetical protein n=1 Tax=Streptomyces sp. NPDC089799 TaxID=3155066 RepID=UPI003445644A